MMKIGKLSFLIAVLLTFWSGKTFSQDLLVSGGNTVSTIICANGFVFTWGNNVAGPSGSTVTGILGNGSTNGSENTPLKVNFPTTDPYFNSLSTGITIKAVDAGSGAHFIAVDCYGGAWSWGNNGFTGGTGLTGTGSSANGTTVPARVLRGLTPGGAAIHASLANYLVDVKYISGGNDNSYAILNSGEAVAWGRNDKGQLANGTYVNSSTPVYILTGPGTRLTGVIQVEAGDETSYALVDPDGDGIGTVYSWGAGTGTYGGTCMLGRNAAGTANNGNETANDNYARPVLNKNGTPLTGIVSISAGDILCLALDATGYVWAWGNGGWGDCTGQGTGVGNHSDPRRVVAGEWGTTAGVGFGETYLKAKAISGGQGFAMAVTTNGIPVAWGNNGACTASASGGNLGDGTSTQRSGPVFIRRNATTYDNNVVSISDGDTWGFYTTTNNQIYAWGNNAFGQLGIGNTTCQSYAIQFTLPPCAFPAPKPYANITPRDFTVCASTYTSTVLNSQFIISAALAADYRITWFRNNTQVAVGNGTTGQTYTATSPGIYKVRVEYIGADAPCTPYLPKEDQITISAYTQNFTVPNPLTFCGTLTPYVNGQGKYNWYKDPTGGTALATTEKNTPASLTKASVNPPSSGTYTVYVEETGMYVGNFGKVTPTACTNISTQNLWNARNIVFTMSTPSVVIDTLSFWARADGNTYNIQLNIYDTRVNNSNIVANNTLYTTPSRSITLPSGGAWVEIKIPVNYTLAGGSGTSYAIGFRNTGNIQIADFSCNYVGRTDDIATGGPYLTSTGAELNTNYSAAWGSISNLKFHTPQGFCDRVAVTLTESCPCAPPTSVSLTPATTSTYCQGSPLTIVGTANISGLTPTSGYVYTWYKGTTVLSSSATYADLAFTSLVPTDAATYKLRVEDGTAGNSACYKEASVAIVVNATTLPGVVAANQTICNGGTPAGLTSTTAASGGNGTTYTYQWQSSTDNITFANIATAGTGTTYAPGALTQTTYYRRNVTSGTVCPTVYSDTVTITVTPALTAGAVGADQTICSGTTPATLTETTAATGGTGTYTYQWQSSTNGTTGWTNIASATAATFTPPSLTATIYYRRVVSSTPCTGQNSNVVAITVLPGLIPGAITASQSICYNTTPTALSSTTAASGGTGTYAYSWESSPDGTTWTPIAGQSGLTYTPSALTATIQYRRVVVSGTGTCNTANTNPVIITVYADLTVGAIGTDQPICENATPAALTNATAPTGGTGTYTYVWERSTNGGANWSTITGASSATYAPSALTTTTMYRRTVTSGSCGSLTTTPVTITVTPNVPVSVSINDPGATCAGAAMSFTATPTNPGAAPTYQWYVNNTAVPGATSTTFNSSTLTNNNQVKVVLTSSITCTTGSPATSNVVTVQVLSNVTPSVTISNPGKICTGSSVTFNITASSGGGAAPTYQWYLNGAPVGTGTTSYTNGSLTNGNTVYVVMTSSLGCATTPTGTSNTVTMNVAPIPNPQIVGTDTTICSGRSVTYTSINGGNTLTWNNASGAVGNGGSITITSSGTYTLTENNGACATTSAPVNVTVIPTPVVHAGQDVYVKEGETTSLNATGATNYTWTPNTGLSSANVANPSLMPSNTLEYTVVGYDATNKCWSSDMVKVFVEKLIVIPNAFTPNGDGNNEGWEIANIESFPNCTVEVYNRWGNLVWKSTGYKLQWDGSNYRNGEGLPDGTYFYVIDLQSKIYKEPYTGYVQIVK